MQEPASFLAVDLGASNGRIMKVDWDGSRFVLDEVYRFPNGGIRTAQHLHWDTTQIWSQIQLGIKKFFSSTGKYPAGIGVDAWGVDYGLLDNRGQLLCDPYHYRDHRTDGVVESVRPVISEAEVFRITGVQTMAINTVYQLSSIIASGSDELSHADTLLLIPDLFQYFLCGEKRAEYTEATTTQLVYAGTRTWAREVAERLGIPLHIFPPICSPGTRLGSMRKSVSENCGLRRCPPCLAVAAHDTASAVAAIPSMDEESIFLSSGTWSLMGVVADRPDTSDEAYRLGFTNEGAADGGILLLKNLNGLWILQECQRCWNRPEAASWNAIEDAATSADAFRSLIDASAADFQSPENMVSQVRQFCKDSGQPVPETLGQIARCVLESLCLLYSHTVQDLLGLTGRQLSTIRIVGGGVMNHLLCQMVADACDIEVVAGPVEAAALGNAVLQAVATGHILGCDQRRVAIGESVHLSHYRPRLDDRWKSSSDQIAVFVDRVRAARVQSKFRSTALTSR